MATTWFTSDLHLGHPYVSELRGFGGVDEHDELILSNLVLAVQPGDTLWVLGDISSGWGPQEERALDLLADALEPLRKGSDPLEVHLIAGNHDSCHPLHEDSHVRQRRFLEVFDSVQSMQIMQWQGQDVWLSHFPRPGYEHEGMESRFDELRLTVPYLVHGHLHSTGPVTAPGQVDVGVDAWDLAPVPQSTVEQTLFSSSR